MTPTLLARELLSVVLNKRERARQRVFILMRCLTGKMSFTECSLPDHGRISSSIIRCPAAMVGRLFGRQERNNRNAANTSQVTPGGFDDTQARSVMSAFGGKADIEI
jgi:hypothetical protein